MWPKQVSNPGIWVLESNVLPTELRGRGHPGHIAQPISRGQRNTVLTAYFSETDFSAVLASQNIPTHSVKISYMSCGYLFCK